MALEGTWEIYEMSNWDADYFNMDVQAYVTLTERGTGEFQFGLVFGGIDGEFVLGGETQRLEFSWEGSDECDEASGSGWVNLKAADELEGFIELYEGDSSTFSAKRA